MHLLVTDHSYVSQAKHHHMHSARVATRNWLFPHIWSTDAQNVAVSALYSSDIILAALWQLILFIPPSESSLADCIIVDLSRLHRHTLLHLFALISSLCLWRFSILTVSATNFWILRCVLQINILLRVRFIVNIHYSLWHIWSQLDCIVTREQIIPLTLQ